MPVTADLGNHSVQPAPTLIAQAAAVRDFQSPFTAATLASDPPRSTRGSMPHTSVLACSGMSPSPLFVHVLSATSTLDGLVGGLVGGSAAPGSHMLSMFLTPPLDLELVVAGASESRHWPEPASAEVGHRHDPSARLLHSRPQEL